MLEGMSGRYVVLFALAGCGFQLSITQNSDAGGGSDVGGLDPDADISMLCTTWDARHVEACDLATPAPPLDLADTQSPYTFDTTVGELRDKTSALLYQSSATVQQADQSLVALMNVEGFRLRAGAQLFVVGNKPLLVASWSEIDVSGIIDAGSHATETDPSAHSWSTTHLGAGANVDCATHAGTVGTSALSSGGSGGGGGGAFNGSGGNGSGGDMCGGGCPRPGGPGGMKFTTPPSVIRGGCPGATSGTAGSGAQSPSTSTTVAAGGGGGGAIELAARTEIRITGQVLAGGAGGAGAQSGAASSGGGGGSGGYIGLDAPRVVITGVVAANGGGGGGSGPFSDLPARGWPGADGQASVMPAPGGDGGSLHPATANPVCGVSGAAGGAVSANGANATAMDACGGGGGGGGAGFVMVFSTMFDGSSGAISPTATI